MLSTQVVCVDASLSFQNDIENTPCMYWILARCEMESVQFCAMSVQCCICLFGLFVSSIFQFPAVTVLESWVSYCFRHCLYFAAVGPGYICISNSNSNVVFAPTMQLGSGHVVGPNVLLWVSHSMQLVSGFLRKGLRHILPVFRCPAHCHH